jgi:hypothetical protein
VNNKRDIKSIFSEGCPILDHAKRLDEVEKKKEQKVLRFNNNPEEIILQEILFKLKVKGFSLNRFESKAKRILTKNGPVWTGSGMKYGVSDILGIDNMGFFVAIEVKARGKVVKSCLRDEQRSFLTEKIQHGGFCIVSDNADKLLEHYYYWKFLEFQNKIKYLLDLLP